MTTPAIEADPGRRVLPPAWPVLALLSAIVLGFRAAAWANPSSFIVISPPWVLPLTGLGVVFLVCGVWAWVSRPSPLTRIFLIFGIGGAVHWGGSIASESQAVEIAFLTFYLAATTMGDGAFLDLALRYPRTEAKRSLIPSIVYLLALLTLLAVPITPFLPKSIVQAGLGFVLFVAFTVSIVAGVIFIVKWFRATAVERREQFLTPIVLVLVVSSVLDLLADQGWMPGAAEAWTLTYGLTPLTLALALTRSSR